MPSPTQTIQRRDLGEVVREYAIEESEKMYNGTKIMPIFRTPLQAGNFPRIPVEEMLKPRDVKRAVRGGYNRGDWGFEQDNYACVEYGWEEVVDDVEAANYDSYFDAESDSAMIAMDVILRAQEQRIAAIVEGQTPNAVANAWVNGTSATPKADVHTGKKAILDYTGVLPDTLAMTWNTLQALLDTDDVNDSIKYTSPIRALGMNDQLRILSTYFGVERILIHNAIVNSASEGQAFNPNGIWSDDKAFLCVTGTGSLRGKPSFGRTMLWEDDSPENVNVETYREEQVRGEIIRARQFTDEKVINTTCGYLLSNLD